MFSIKNPVSKFETGFFMRCLKLETLIPNIIIKANGTYITTY